MAFPAATPMRNVPGAFFNTPAAAPAPGLNPDPNGRVRRRLFPGAGQPAYPPAPGGGAGGAGAGAAANAAAGGLGPVGAPAGGLVPIARAPAAPGASDPVTKAARAINHFLQSDGNYPDLDSYCRQGASSDYDLPVGDLSWQPFHKTQMYPIPNQVFEHYNAGELQTSMGLFAEINHAWVAIDSSLYLWDYTLPEPELIGFEESQYSISAVALVKPKPDMFTPNITHVLVVATAAEMILLGVAATTTAAGTKTVSLYQTQLADNISGIGVSTIVGSESGRIFFGGTTTAELYELYYQKEERWFVGRCGKINQDDPYFHVKLERAIKSFWADNSSERIVEIVVDDSRKLVYTLSNLSTIRTYHMETFRLNKVIVKEKNHCLRDITHMINASPLLNERMKLVSISAVSSKEASKIHLMALTHTGCRLFLSATNSTSYMLGSSGNLAPQSMQVQFIKFPPPQRPSPTAYAAESVFDMSSRALETSRLGQRFAPGYFLDFVVKEKQPDVDLLFVSAPETGRIKNIPPTSTMKYHEHGMWIELGSRAESVGPVMKAFAAAKQPVGFGNELAVQYDDPSSEFAVLTNTGIHIIRRRRLVDIFAAAIKAAVGDEGLEQVARKFIQLYGRVETVSTALAVACGHGSDSRPGAPRPVDQATEDRARTVFVDFGGQPTMTETDATPLTVEVVKLSSRHDALATYVARLVRSLWKETVITASANGAGVITVTSTIPVDRLAAIQENLERLRRFLKANRGLIQGLSGPSDLGGVKNRADEVAIQAEHQALHALQQLMESISEGISFVLMLFDERVTDIYLRLDTPQKEQLRGLKYENLFSQTSGKDLAKMLVKSIVNRNIESGSNVETVADALRRRCGSFCSPDDVITFKAQEQLKKASEHQGNVTAARGILLESLRLFEKVAGSLSFANLQAAILQYIDLQYFAGAIELCLGAAQERDRGNTALTWINDGRPAGDPRANAFNERKRCYDLIHDVLTNLDHVSAAEPEMVDGRLTLMAHKRLEAYNVVNGSEDEVFHFDLYEWYISQGWTDRILAIESPHVVTFLTRLASTNAEHAELLCRFYTNRSRFFDAAQVQHELAISDFPIQLKNRITLLSRAKANANVPTPGVSRQQLQLLNHDVTELLEVAQIQDDLMERLQADRRIDAGRRAEIKDTLDGPILDLSTLFNDFADQAGYYDLCLLIYHAADYRNSATVTGTWRQLIGATHEEIEARMNEGDPLHDLPAPYESVSQKVQTIAHRTSLDSFIFPIAVLIPEICRYSLAYEQDGRIGASPTWPVQLFLSLGVSHDMVMRVLDGMHDSPDHDFRGQARFRVYEWVVFVSETWLAEVRRRGGGTGNNGAGGLAPWVVELLRNCEQGLPPAGTGTNPGGADLADIRRRSRTVRRDIETLLDRANGPRW